MSRNHYDEQHGVCRLRWVTGEPDNPYAGPVVVEVWRARTSIESHEPTKPRVIVEATTEVRVWADGAWKEVRWNGGLVDPVPGEVRRHARLNVVRTWAKTIVLDGWSA